MIFLHNTCVAAGDFLGQEVGEGQDTEESEDDASNPEADEKDMLGNAVQARLAAQLSTLAELLVCLGEHDYIQTIVLFLF